MSTEEADKRLKEVEAERDLWLARFNRLMGWVKWLRDDVSGFTKRPFARCNWQGLNRSVGTEDLFMASIEIEAEVEGDALGVSCLAESKDEQFRALALQAAEQATTSGKRGRES